MAFRRLALSAAAVLLLATACSVSFGGASSRPRLDPTPAGTPFPDPVDDPALARSLLTADEFLTLDGAPSGIEEVSAQDAGLTENPDPRGPCGQIADAAEIPPWGDAALSVFTWDGSPQGSLTHGIWDLPEGDAARLYAKYRRQYEPGCPPYESETPWGTQTVTVGPPIEILYTGRSEAFGFTMDVTIENGGGAAAGVAVMQRGTRLGFVMVLAEGPVSDRFLSDVTTLAARRL